jgi:hypothetical protein
MASVATWTSPGMNNAMRTSLAAALKKKPKGQPGFTPWTPPVSPVGSAYDPALGTMVVGPDGQLYGQGGQAGQAQRGYDYLYGDTADQNARDAGELGLSVQGLERQRDRSLADILMAKTRWDTDHGQADLREAADYGTATADLGQNYQRMGASQAGNAVQAGVQSGGTFAAALAARTANQAHDQGAIDTSHTRYLQDSAQALDRSNQDFIAAQTRTQQDYGTDDLGAIGQAQRTGGYTLADRLKQVAQSGVENQHYQQDLNDQRWYQATQAGYAAPAKGTPGGQPANEYTDPSGNAYRIVVRGTRRYRVDPQGNEKFVGTRPKVKK